MSLDDWENDRPPTRAGRYRTRIERYRTLGRTLSNSGPDGIELGTQAQKGDGI